MKRIVAALLSIGFVVSAMAEDCLPPTEKVPEWSWQTDEAFEIIPLNKDGTSYRFVGDLIRINFENFRSLLRKPSDAAPNIRELIFDARVIWIEGPISLEGAKVRFLADEIHFEKGAIITLSKTPPVSKTAAGDTSANQSDGDGLAVVARKISFSNKFERPFNFFTAGGDIDQATRRLQIVAEHLISDGEEIQPPEAISFFRLLTLDSLFNRGSEKATSIQVGPSATTSYWELFHNQAYWPAAFAAKLARYYAVAPYDADNNIRISQLAKNYLPSLERWRSGGPTIEVLAILNNIQQGIDAYGFRAAQVPRIAFEQIVSDVNAKLKMATDSPYATALESQMISPFDQDLLDTDLLASLRKERDASEAILRTRQDEFDGKLNDLATMNQKLQTQQDKIKLRRDRLAFELDERKQKDKNGWETAQQLKWVGMAMTMLPVSAPVGVALSVGVGLASDAIYRHNAPDAPADGSFLITFEQMYAQSKSFSEKTSQVKDAWAEFVREREVASDVWRNQKPDPSVLSKLKSGKSDHLPTKAEAASDVGNSAIDFYKRAKELFELATLPKPADVQMNGLEAEDQELGELLKNFQQLNNDRGFVVAALGNLKADIMQLADRVTKLTAAEGDLLVVDVKNDRDISRQATTAKRLRSDLYAELYRSAALLRRAAFYANLHPSAIVADLSGYPDEALARARMAKGDTLPVAYGKKWMEDRLADEKRKATVAVESLVSLVTQEHQEYEAREGIRGFRPIITVSKRDGGPRGLFVEALNDAIRSQINDASRAAARDYSPPLPLPVDWIPDVDALRFVTANPTSLQFKDSSSLEGKVIYFRIFHPGYGTMNSDGICRKFDFRDENFKQAYTDTPVSSGTPLKSWQEVLNGNIAVKDDFMFKLARFPLRTYYTISVYVSGDTTNQNWARVPEIDAIEITHVAIK